MTQAKFVKARQRKRTEVRRLFTLIGIAAEWRYGVNMKHMRLPLWQNTKEKAQYKWYKLQQTARMKGDNKTMEKQNTKQQNAELQSIELQDTESRNTKLQSNNFEQDNIRKITYKDIADELGDWELGDLYRTNDPALGGWPW